MNRHTTLLFDLDGTLLDTLGDLTASVNFSLQQHAFPTISAQDTRRFLGDGYAKLIERAIPEGASNPHFSRCLEEFAEHYNRNMMCHTKPYPGILDLLAELKRKEYQMAVVSNKNNVAVKTLVEHYFGKYIQTAIGASAEIAHKPDPSSVHKALEELDANPNTTLYVGDSDVDILTARNAGLPCVCVSWGFCDKEFLKKNGASTIIDRPMDLLAVLGEQL